MRFGTSQELPKVLWHTKSHPDQKRNNRDMGLGPFHRAEGVLQMGFQKWTFSWLESTVFDLGSWFFDILDPNASTQSHITTLWWQNHLFGHGKAPKMIKNTILQGSIALYRFKHKLFSRKYSVVSVVQLLLAWFLLLAWTDLESFKSLRRYGWLKWTIG